MIRVMIAGMGNMGISHALACHESPDFRIVGLVNRSIPDLPDSLRDYPLSHDYAEALARLKPDLVVIATYSDSHADFAVAAPVGSAFRLGHGGRRGHGVAGDRRRSEAL